LLNFFQDNIHYKKIRKKVAEKLSQIQNSLEMILKYIDNISTSRIDYSKNIYNAIEKDNSFEWKLLYYIRQYFIYMKENVIFLYPYDKNINYVDHIPFVFYYGYDNELNLSKIFG